MKKIITFATLVLALAACSKQPENMARLAQSTGETFYSKVQYFKDHRTPGTDTVWTLRMLNQQMVDSFSRLNGYVYWESSTVNEVGVLYTRF